MIHFLYFKKVKIIITKFNNYNVFSFLDLL